MIKQSKQGKFQSKKKFHNLSLWRINFYLTSETVPDIPPKYLPKRLSALDHSIQYHLNQPF
jgi:hypothetical protein